MTEKDGKFILMNMDDKRSKKVAEVISNPTCKKIIDYLTYNSEKSEEDIAKALDMKINTVEYNLKKLLDSGLIEKAKNFFWSKRGKKILLYKLAKKHIVISPKNSKPNFDLLKTIIPVIMSIALVFALFLFSNPSQEKEELNLEYFNSLDDLENFLQDNTATQRYFGTGIEESFATDATTTSQAGAVPSSNDAELSKSSSDDYSQTNVQVIGVDEPDIVKNDGEFIYTLTYNKVVIVDAYPADQMNIVSEIEIKNPTNMFLNGNQLIIFHQDYSYGDSLSATVYDITNRENPVLEKEIAVEGHYIDARMIGDFVYFVSNKYAGGNNPLPLFVTDGVKEEVSVREIGYFPIPDASYTFTNIVALDLGSLEYEHETFLLGSSYTLYMSEENLFLTGTKYIDQNDYYERFIEDVIYKIFPKKITQDIRGIMDEDSYFYEKEERISRIIQDYSNSLTGKEKAEFDSKLEEEVKNFQTEIAKEQEQTIIHKINLDKNEIDYLGNTQVPGRVLNQFSMDEYDGNFRIATTVGNSWRDTSLNNLYVLDENLDLIGEVEDLAKGEQIYSTRFMGERAYMVTFKQTDPLFVIDLKNPENPQVLGELKVTGFSSYLHPYDETHLIGIGKEADLNGRAQGVKISIFDVSDMENPIETAKYEVEEKWSNSEALYNHKAVLFDKEKNLLVLPMSYNYEEPSLEGKIEYKYWNGAYVFDASVDAIKLRGTIVHNNENSTSEYSKYRAIERSLYLDDILYTISRYSIQANNLTKNLDEISHTTIQEGENYYPGPYFIEGSKGVATDSILE